MSGGPGNNTLTGGDGKDVFYFYEGNVTDTITDYSEGQDKIYLANVSSVSGVLNGSDVIFTVGNGTINVNNAKDKAVTIIESDGVEYIYTNGSLPADTTQPDTIPPEPAVNYNGVTVTLEATRTDAFSLSAHNATATIKAVNVDGSEVRNSIRIYGDDENNILRAGKSGGTVYGGGGDDIIYFGNGNDLLYYYSNDGNDWVYNYKSGDLILTRRIDQWDETTFKNFALSGNDVIINFTSGSSITLKDAKDQKIRLSGHSYNRSEYYYSTGYSGNLYEYNGTYGYLTASGNSVSLNANYTGDFMASVYASPPNNIDASSVRSAINIYADDGNNTIHGSNISNSTIHAGAGNDVIYCGNGSDVIYYYTDEGNKTIYNYKSGDLILTRRIDQWDETTFKNFALSGNDVIINFTSGSSITLKDAKDQKIRLSGHSYNRSEYYYSTGYSGNLYEYNGTYGYLTASGNSVSLNANYTGDFMASVYASPPNNIDASSVKIATRIYGDDRANIINAAKAGGTVFAGAGNDTIYCGAGNDTLYYYSDGGNDTVFNYKTNDVIFVRQIDQYDETTLKNFTFNGKDVVVNLTSGNSITLKDAKDQYIDLRISRYNSAVGSHNYRNYATYGKVSISGGTVSLQSDYQGNCSVTSYANTSNINASAVNATTNLYGDNNNNVIYAGKSGGSLFGGEGNDTIYCGAGRDSIVYYDGGGNDTVYNIGNNDGIYLNKCTAEKISVNGTDVIITTDNNETITLKDGAGKSIFITGKGTQTYTSSSNAMIATSNAIETPWFAEDNNFVTNDLDSIMDADNSISRLTTNSSTDLTPLEYSAQDDFILTYAHDK